MNRLALLLLGIACAASASAQSPPYTITISPRVETVTSGDPIDVVVTFKNLTNHGIDFSANISDLTGIDPNCSFEVTDDHGAPVQQKKYPHSELATGHAVFRILEPGESITETESVGRLFDMSKPGKYVIQVSRPNFKDKSAAVVRSNKITIAVLPN
jgi:hypothetical protein